MCRLEYELHKLGYTFYSIPGLTLVEIERLAKGIELEAEEQKDAQDKAERESRQKYGG
jgi:hypothetical protein